MKNNYWLKNGIITLAQQSLTVLLGFLSFYFLLKILNKDEYGTWVLFLATVSIIEMARNGLTQEALIKFLSAADEEQKKHIITSTFTINICVTTLIIVGLYFIAPYLSRAWSAGHIVAMLHLYSVAFILTGIINQLNYIEQAHFSFTGTLYATLARQLLFLCYILYCYFTHTVTDLIRLTQAQVLSISTAAVLAFLFSRKRIQYSTRLHKGWIKKIFKFGKYTFGVSLSTTLAGSIDQMMLGAYLSKVASGVFNIAVRITNLTDIPTNAMASILFPKSTVALATDGPASVKYLYERSVGVILALLIPSLIFMAIFANYVILLIAGKNYSDATPLLRVVLITCVFGPYGRQAGIILSSAGKTKFNFYIVVVTALLIIIFNFFLIRAIGSIGAAYATLLATVFSFLVSQIYIHRLYNISVLNPWVYAYRFYPEMFNRYFRKNT